MSTNEEQKQNNKENPELWRDIVNPETGEHSLKYHTLKTVWTSCKKDDHYFEVPEPRIREAVCKYCAFIKPFILGMQIVKDGKVLEISQK